MENKLTPYDEAYYRVSFEIAKLLKQAGFNYKCTTCYDNTGYYWDREFNSSHNRRENRYSAPLIEVALYWIKELNYTRRYFSDCVKVYHNDPFGVTSPAIWEYPLDTKNFSNKREDNILFIATCCTYIIETQNKQ